MSIDVKAYQKKQTKKTPKQESNWMDVLNKDIKIGSLSVLNDAIKERFYSQMHILLETGVNVDQALQFAVDDQKKEKTKTIFEQLRKDIIKGLSLSQAMQAQNEFSAYEYYSVQIGETSGKLLEVFQELSNFYNKKIKQRRQIISALSYPAIVISVAFGALVFLLNFMVPMFQDLFLRTGNELPWITELVVQFSDSFSSALPYIIVAFFGIGFGMFSMKDNEQYRKYQAKVLLHLPLIGAMMHKIYLGRFCQSLALLIAAEVPLMNAIKLVRKMIGFYPLEQACDQIEIDLMNGQFLYDSMGRIKIFPAQLNALVKIGEEVNELDRIFNKIAAQYSDEVEHQSSMLGTFIEPIMIIFLAILVSIILIAMYLPMFQISASMGF